MLHFEIMLMVLRIMPDKAEEEKQISYDLAQ